MRTRAEIEARNDHRTDSSDWVAVEDMGTVIELLLDIRDQLNDLNHVHGLREHNVPKS